MDVKQSTKIHKVLVVLLVVMFEPLTLFGSVICHCLSETK